MGLAIYKHRTPQEIEEYYNNIATEKINNLCKTYETQITNKKIKFNKYLETIEDENELKEQQILIQDYAQRLMLTNWGDALSYWVSVENEIKLL